MNKKENIICWFSCGVTSTIAIKKTIEKYGNDFNILIYYFHIDSAHSDNERFLKECEEYFGIKINILKSKKYKDQYEVIEKTKYVNGKDGARCTLELKKNLRFQIEKEIDYKYQVMGFEFSKKEINRAIRFIEQYPNAKAIFPLIELGLSKKECFKILKNANIEIPKMYKIGYSNNNCIGCVKGGQGYWNKIRKDFPEYFNKMIKMEEIAGHSCIKNIFLKDLPLNTGHKQKISLPDCSNRCEIEFGNKVSPKMADVYNKIKNISDYYKY